MKETWKQISLEYGKNYECSNLGRIRNKSKKILKQRIKKTKSNSYYMIDFHENGKVKSYMVHRVIASCFIPNPNNLPQVNHKDENGLNNNIGNLEWCTNKYNCNYGTRNKRLSDKSKERLCNPENNPMFKKEHSKESKEKMSKNHYNCKGKNNPRAIKVFCDNKIFDCMKDCAEYYNLSKSTICSWLKGYNKMPEKFKKLGLKYLKEE